MRILLVPWISVKPFAEEDGARLGECGSEKRKWQNYFAKSEACASSSHWKAEFQHLLRLLIFFRFAVPKSVRCLQLSETCCVRLVCFEYMSRHMRGAQSCLFHGKCGQDRVPVMLCSPIRGCVSGRLPAASGHHRVRGGESHLKRAEKTKGLKESCPWDVGHDEL